MGPVLKEHFADYGAFHATPGNKACHSVGIPMIFFAVLALLGHVPLARVSGFTVTLAEPVILAVTLYYMVRNDAWLRGIFRVDASPALWFEIQPISAAVFGVPLGLAVMVVVSLLTPAPGERAAGFVEGIRYPRSEA